MEGYFNIERAYERIEELEEFIKNFPESPLADVFRHAVEELGEELAKHGG